MSEESIMPYTAEELAKRRARGEDKTDWARVDAMTEADLEAAIAADPESDIPPEAWDAVTAGLPEVIEPKKHINIRLDADVWRWFKRQGKGYQTRINAVLRAYMLAERRKPQHEDPRH